MRNHIVRLTSLVCAFHCGCISDSRYSYTTVPNPPARDTKTAQQLNMEGLRKVEDNDFAQAEKLFREALDADLLFAPAHNNLGLTLLEAGKAYEAAWEFQFAAKLQPHAVEPRNNLGLVMEKVADLDAAIAQYELALEIDPDNVEAMAHWSRAQIKAGKKPENLRDTLQKLVFQNPGGTWDQWARRQLIALGHGE